MASALGKKPYACPVPGCGKCFTEYSSLYKHQVVHTHSRPYSCNICGKAYSQRSTLGTHKCSGHRELEATEESEEVQQQLEGEQSLPRHLQCVMPRGRGETDGSKGARVCFCCPSDLSLCCGFHLIHKAQIHVTAKSKVLPPSYSHRLRVDCIQLCSTGRLHSLSRLTLGCSYDLLLLSVGPSMTQGQICTFLLSPISLFAFPDLVAAP